MAERKWVADDGTIFDSKKQVMEYEERTPHLDELMDVHGLQPDKAKDILEYFEKNFRAPKARAKRKPPAPVPPPTGTPPPSTSASAQTAPAAGAKKK